MRRRPAVLLPLLSALVLLGACTPWSQLGGGPARTGRSTAAVGLDLVTVASVGLEERWRGSTGPVSVPPVLTADRVFVATDDAPGLGGPAVLAFRRDGTGCSGASVATCTPEWLLPLTGAPTGLAVIGAAVAVTSADIPGPPPHPDQHGLAVVPQAPGAHCDVAAVLTCDPTWVAAGPWPSAPAVVDDRLLAVGLDDLDQVRVASFALAPAVCEGSGAVPVCDPQWISVGLAAAGLPPWGVAVAGSDVWIGAAGSPVTPSSAPALLAFPVDGAGCDGTGGGLVCSPVRAVELAGEPIGVPSVVEGRLLALQEIDLGTPLGGLDGALAADPVTVDVVAVDLLACGSALCTVAWEAPAPSVAAPAHVGSAGPGRLALAGDDGWVVYDVAACEVGDLDGCLDLQAGIEGVARSPMAATDDVSFVGHAGTTVAADLPGDGGVHAFDPAGALDCGQVPGLPPTPYDWCTPVWSGLEGVPVTVTPVPGGDELHVVADGTLRVLGPPAGL